VSSKIIELRKRARPQWFFPVALCHTEHKQRQRVGLAIIAAEQLVLDIG
jgi:hypothetical protein